MGKSDLFRKSSLERISSPEQLDEYIKVVNPNLILMIIAVFSILFAGLVWIFSSDIPKYQNIPGVVISEDGKKNLYSYVDIGTSKKLTVGMDTRISPDYLPPEEYGYINGKITKIGLQVVDSEDIMNKFTNPSIVASILPSGTCIEVVTELGSPSKEEIASVDIIDGSICISKVVIGQEKAIDFIFNKKSGVNSSES